MLNDLHYSIEKCFEINNEGLNDKLEENEVVLRLAYRVFFWGSQSKHVIPENIDEEQKKICINIVSILKEFKINQRRIMPKPIKFNYTTNDKPSNTVKARFILLSGHSSRLAHYYRQLYQTCKHIHYTSEFKDEVYISSDKIDFRFIALRAQMTNEEQLLLYYNYRYGFGGKWDYRYDNPKNGSSKFRFFTKYLMLHNVPLYDTMHEKAESPIDHFESYVKENPGCDLFEWGGY